MTVTQAPDISTMTWCFSILGLIVCIIAVFSFGSIIKNLNEGIYYAERRQYGGIGIPGAGKSNLELNLLGSLFLFIVSLIALFGMILYIFSNLGVSFPVLWTIGGVILPFFNGTITNDKFCLSRTAELRLSWRRSPRGGRKMGPGQVSF